MSVAIQPESLYAMAYNVRNSIQNGTVVMGKVLLLCVFALMITDLNAEKVPASAWQKGTLLSIKSEQISGPVVISGALMIQRTDTLTHFAIAGTNFIYRVDRRTKPRDMPLDVVIHGDVTFAVLGATVYLKDEAGKVHKLSLVAKEMLADSGS